MKWKDKLAAGFIVSGTVAREVNPPQSGDILTTEHFAKRILSVTLTLKT